MKPARRSSRALGCTTDDRSDSPLASRNEAVQSLSSATFLLILSARKHRIIETGQLSTQEITPLNTVIPVKIPG